MSVLDLEFHEDSEFSCSLALSNQASSIGIPLRWDATDLNESIHGTIEMHDFFPAGQPVGATVLKAL